jgi:alpha-tubulin suppressor-like RCC1 family protein
MRYAPTIAIMLACLPSAALGQAKSPTQKVCAEAHTSAFRHSCTAKQDGTAWCWGRNDYGQLGDGTNNSSVVPVRVLGLSGVASVVPGPVHTCAVKRDGTIYCWGSNCFGGLGDAAQRDQIAVSPVQLPILTGVTALSIGYAETCAVKSDGTVWCWGGMIGNCLGGFRPCINNPRKMKSITEVRSISIGYYHSCVIRNNGTVWCWASDAFGLLHGIGVSGDGNKDFNTTPAQIAALTGVVAISAGAVHTCAVKKDGTAWCWGNNQAGQLGDGTKVYRAKPTLVRGLFGVTAILANNYHTCAIKRNGSVWCWGDNRDGNLGDGGTTTRTTPNAVRSLANAYAFAPTALKNTCVRKSDGTTWCWGNNEHGKLGNGTSTLWPTPVQVRGLNNVTSITANTDDRTCAIKRDGTAWCWGENGGGALGDGTKVNRNIPVRVRSLSGVSAIASGKYHSCAVKNDGTVWCWGENKIGVLGDGSTVSKLVPRKLLGISGAASIAVANIYTCALKRDSTVWCWGRQAFGEVFKDGTITAQLIPLQIPGFNDVVAVSAGAIHRCAVKADGTVWCWGGDGLGALGDDTTVVGSRTPILIPGISNAATVSAGGFSTCAVSRSKKVWCWAGTVGRVNDPTTNASPRKIPGINNVLTITKGENFSCAVKQDGTAWCWGKNQAGQLGSGNMADNFTPTQVVGLTDVVAIAAGGQHTCAVKRNGTAWCWGRNSSGQLGDGTKAISLPTKVLLP